MRAYGEGSVYQRADGRWEGILVTGWDADGKPIRKHVYGQTQKEAAGKLHRLKRLQEDAGFLPRGKSPTLAQWVNYYLDTVAPARDLKATTLEDYRKYLHRWVLSDRAARVKLEQLQPEDIEGIYKRMRETVSPSTVHHMHRILRTVLNAAVKRGRLAVSPIARIDAPRIEEKAPTVLTTEQAKRIVRVIESRDDAARWLVAVTLGLRQGEALGLGWDDVDLEAGTLTVRRAIHRVPWKHGCRVPCGKTANHCPSRHGGGRFYGPPKTSAGSRALTLPRPVLDALRDHRVAHAGRLVQRKGQHHEPFTDPNGVAVDLVFCQPSGRPLPEHKDWETWKAILRDADAPDVRLHDARHLAATTMLLMGVDRRVVMGLMGWSQAALLDRYQHVLEEMRDDAATRIEGAFWSADRTPPEGVIDLASRRRSRGVS
ncbi:tyrosine-type recombinase/integrase [Kocuria sp. CPCC 205300]|uniref:tyrosine-type recombinase/integrase n=1 Tax=Kocuria sabuli TaxID=3071448 RepID=UPI0036DE8418